MASNDLLQDLSLIAAPSDWLRLIVASRHVGLTIADATLPGTPLIYASDGFLNLTGYARDEVIGQNCKFLQGPGTKAETVAEITSAILGERIFSGVILNYRRDRSPFWNELILLPAQSRSSGRYIIGLQIDVSAQMRRGGFDGTKLRSPGSIAGFLSWFPDTDELHPSRELFDILGVDTACFTPTIPAIAALFPPDQAKTLIDTWADGCAGRARYNIEACATIGDIIRYLRIDVKPISREDGTIERVVATFEDSSRGLANERRLRLLAYSDQLTGLLNRQALIEHFDLSAGRHGGAVLVVALRHLKEVSDAFGHEVGDQALRVIAQRLKDLARGNDVVARLDGDEFGLILRGSVEDDEVRQLAARLARRIAEPVDLDGRRVQLNSVVGFAMVPEDAGEAQDALSKAYLALSDAKAQGVGSIVRFSPALRERAEARRALAQRLRAALRDKRITVHFQPQIDLRSGRLHGFETLVRWRDVDGSYVPPSEFIPVAEEEGLIGMVGALVVKKTLIQIRRWLDRGVDPGTVAVNVAADQIRDPGFPAWIVGQLTKHGVAPGRISIELTENIFVDRYADIILENLKAISGAGIAIALDDFGTGWATLTHLRQFPLDVIKIDRSFVMKLEMNRDDAAICRAIIGLAHNLGMRVTAEGIETLHQLELLKGLGCDYGQGYYFSRPQPAQDITRWLTARAVPAQAPDRDSAEEDGAPSPAKRAA